MPTAARIQQGRLDLRSQRGVGGFRPGNRLFAFMGNQEKALAAGGGAEIGRVQNTPLRLVAQRLQGKESDLEVLDSLFRIGASSLGQRAPGDELGHIFDDDGMHVRFGKPVVDCSGIHAALIMERLAAAGAGVMDAFRAGQRQVASPFGHQS